MDKAFSMDENSPWSQESEVESYSTEKKKGKENKRKKLQRIIQDQFTVLILFAEYKEYQMMTKEISIQQRADFVII